MIHLPSRCLSRRNFLRASGFAAGAALLPPSLAAARQASPVATEPVVRARDLGVPFEGTPGPYNAITDVPGVGVGHVTLIDGDGPLVVGQGPIRTGVTCIAPRIADPLQGAFAAVDVLNGNGVLASSLWIEESGFLDGPIILTNTLSVPVAMETISDLAFTQFGVDFGLPTVAETWDGQLNDIHGRHVKAEHVVTAFQSAADGPVAEGNVGGGTGMMCHGFKGGIGTSSRTADYEFASYTVGALVQANHGYRSLLKIAGVPVGLEIADLTPEIDEQARSAGDKVSSIIIVIATDAPLLPNQLKRLARRASLGIGVTGGIGDNGSGDIAIAFSTAPVGDQTTVAEIPVEMLPNVAMDFLMWLTVLVVEEAIVNALVAAETMTGINGNTVHALPHDRLQDALRKYNRLATA